MEAMDGFWDDSENASKIQKEKSLLEDSILIVETLENLFDEFNILYEYAIKDKDQDSLNEALLVYDKFMDSFLKAEQKILLSGEVDSNNAIITINAGAGGTESCDWAMMLYRMITRFCETKGFKITALDVSEGEAAGIKSATCMVEGNYAFGLLKSESGVHRLVRISPFDSNARRHTSFASIFVSPQVDDNIEIKIEDKDIRIDVYRSGGAGGQGVNTTDSAVRITHYPSGIVVTCQNGRSQIQNKAQAMMVLRSRLFEMKMREKQEKLDAIEAQKKENGWGSQIRSYVLHPYKLVKDHRNNFEVFNAEKVLEGDLDLFVDNFLRWQVMEQIAKKEGV